MKTERLKIFLPLVDFIAAIAGPHCEVVLHDVKDPDNSIIAIKNGQISGRQVGGPLTDLGLQLLRDKVYRSRDALVNYPARTKDGRPLRSSTFFIKNDDGEIAGMLCVNMDLSTALQARQFIDNFIIFNSRAEEEATNRNNGTEIMNHSVEDLMFSLIQQTVEQIDIPPERMSPNEKADIVQKLNEKGFFLLKGAVTEAARYLKTSESTIYRYLTKK